MCGKIKDSQSLHILMSIKEEEALNCTDQSSNKTEDSSLLFLWKLYWQQFFNFYRDDTYV